MRVTSSSVALVMFLLAGASPPIAASSGDLSKLDPLSRQRALAGSGWSRVIVRATDGSAATGLGNAIGELGGRPGRALRVIDALVADVPNGKLAALAGNPRVARISLDRLALGSMERTGATVSATTVRQTLGLDGSGVGVGSIRSGLSAS